MKPTEQMKTLKQTMSMAIKLKHSRLTPATYLPSPEMAEQDHIVLAVNNSPLLSLGLKGDKETQREAKRLLNSEALVRIAQKEHFSTVLNIQTVNGRDLPWCGKEEMAIARSEIGVIELGNTERNLHWIVFGRNAIGVATILSIDEDIQKIAYGEK